MNFLVLLVGLLALAFTIQANDVCVKSCSFWIAHPMDAAWVRFGGTRKGFFNKDYTVWDVLTNVDRIYNGVYYDLARQWICMDLNDNILGPNKPTMNDLTRTQFHESYIALHDHVSEIDIIVASSVFTNPKTTFSNTYGDLFAYLLAYNNGSTGKTLDPPACSEPTSSPASLASTHVAARSKTVYPIPQKNMKFSKYATTYVHSFINSRKQCSRSKTSKPTSSSITYHSITSLTTVSSILETSATTYTTTSSAIVSPETSTSVKTDSIILSTNVPSSSETPATTYTTTSSANVYPSPETSLSVTTHSITFSTAVSSSAEISALTHSIASSTTVSSIPEISSSVTTDSITSLTNVPSSSGMSATTYTTTYSATVSPSPIPDTLSSATSDSITVSTIGSPSPETLATSYTTTSLTTDSSVTSSSITDSTLSSTTVSPSPDGTPDVSPINCPETGRLIAVSIQESGNIFSLNFDATTAIMDYILSCQGNYTVSESISIETIERYYVARSDVYDINLEVIDLLENAYLSVDASTDPTILIKRGLLELSPVEKLVKLILTEDNLSWEKVTQLLRTSETNPNSPIDSAKSIAFIKDVAKKVEKTTKALEKITNGGVLEILQATGNIAAKVTTAFCYYCYG
ncbi:hypothetical protein HK096_006221 [Nowakowskiella sp. JEL0078]|nr:hypothetical protein HK096_006221 [Nowakowskiella sp. JEL0078]